MGWIRHHAIIATTYSEENLAKLTNRLAKRKIYHLTSEPALNGYRTVIIPPDGSKEGWEESNEGDRRRDIIVEILKSLTNTFEWVEVQYGEVEPSICRQGGNTP